MDPEKMLGDNEGSLMGAWRVGGAEGKKDSGKNGSSCPGLGMARC